MKIFNFSSFLFTVIAICVLSNVSNAQSISINNTGTAPDPSAMLDISSTSKGMLVPRMNTSSRVMINNPAQGLLVYDTDSRSFWFYEGQWREIGGGTPTGPAFGDLSGSYPSPNVVKIQNLDVAFGVPFDKQVLKWDALANNWKGRNDSLFLPYNVTFANNGASVFGITTNSTTNGSSALYGKRGATGSGITPGNTMGVWGDNSNGLGVVGTSNTGIGTYGLSLGNHGVYGYSTLANFAGVVGSHANANGIGVLGEIQNAGKAVMGRSTFTSGKAGYFISTHTDHTDTTLTVTTTGKGLLSEFNVNNATNDKPAIDVTHVGNGNGIKVRQTKTNSPANAVDIIGYGNGYSLYTRGENNTAVKFENTNNFNAFPVFSLSNISTGSAMTITSLSGAVTSAVVDINNMGQGRALNIASAKGHAGYFAMTDVTSTNSVINVQQPSNGRGVEIALTKNTNTQPALWVNSQGSLGIQGIANAATGVGIHGMGGSSANDAVGVKGTTGTSALNGIGVLGQAGASDPNGIGVKGIAGGGIAGGIGVLGIGLESNPQAIAVKGIGYTHNEDVGAITGINMTDGVGVYGESQGPDGIGVVGAVGNTGSHSVAAMFKNNFNNNDRAVVELITNGKGNGIYMEHTNLTNTSPLFRIRNSGNGQFLRFENGLGSIKTTLSKEGNLDTEGTITVKGDKGIVRNSTSTQLRTEILTAIIPAGNLNHYDQFYGSVVVDVNFATAFSSPPSVYIGNVAGGTVHGCTVTVQDVTTTDCKLTVINYTPYDFSWVNTTYKLVAIGAE